MAMIQLYSKYKIWRKSEISTVSEHALETGHYPIWNEVEVY